MTKAQSTRHRYTTLVHWIYALAVLACLAWCVLLFMDVSDRLVAGAFALCNLLPLVAYVIDVINANEAKEK